jgi:hypothetical protein|tara:strand:+ start:49 stop:243 length:195 start_codon:yes stop_codon:yes gene_type:complete
MLKQEELDQQKVELINDLVATSTVMEELWRYHPENPDKKDVVSEYEILVKIKVDIENEIKELGS